jgi:hypothetical protein
MLLAAGLHVARGRLHIDLKQMPYITLIPGIVCILVLFRSGTRSAFLNVLLPVLLLFPTNFFLMITHLPNLTFVDVTLLVLGLGLAAMDLPRWKFSRMDIYVAIFIFSCGYSEWVHYAAWRAGALAVMDGLVPYMAAKLLLDQPRMAIETIKRFVLLVTAASLVGMYEFVFKRNPYSYVWSHFYPGQWGFAGTQVRWGFGRMSGPYTQSELAGIIIMAALLLALWLMRWPPKGSWFVDPDAATGGVQDRKLPRTKMVMLLLGVSLYMTQARGPWIGTMVALAIASIGRAPRPGRRAVILLTFFVVVGIPAYQFGKDYLSGPRTDYGSEKETAQYRAELIDNYIPLAESGGAWGLGRMVPIVHGQTSIDNEYLFVWLVQGYAGLATFLLIVIEAAVAFTRAGIRASAERDRQLLFGLLGIVLGTAFILTTVWLGAQSFELLFLLVGWSQVIQPEAIEDPMEQEIARPQWLQEREAMRVYT